MLAQTRVRRPLQVVYVRDHLIPSGGTAALLDNLSRFDPKRILPSLCVIRARDHAADAFEDAGVPTICIGHRWLDPRCLLAARAWVRSRRPAFLVLSGPRSLVVGGLLARWLGLPTSPFFNHMIPDSAPMTLVQRGLSSTTAIGVASSYAVRDWACARYRLSPAQVEVIYPGRDMTRFAPLTRRARERVRADLGLSSSQPVIAMIGRLMSAQKGQDLMLRAMTDLLPRCPAAMLLIVGDGPDRAALERLSSELRIGPAIRFLGWRDEIPEIVGASDVVVVPSVVGEAFGLAALEGMAAERPVVAFATGGLKEIVRDGETGILVPTGDAAALASAIARIVTDAALADRLGAAGRRIAAGFTIEARVENVSALYERIAALSRA